MTDTPEPPAMMPEQRAVEVVSDNEMLWQDYCDAATAHGSTDNGAIDLYDIDGMFEAARALFDKLEADGLALTAAQAEITRLSKINVKLCADFNLMNQHGAKQDTEIARLTAALATARADADKPRPVETAPKDGAMIRLLVDYEGVENWMPLTDDNQSWTIGFNDLQNVGEDEWVFVGWNWSQDCFQNGEGKVIGWLPFDAIAKGATT